jgi:hypothetical protein
MAQTTARKKASGGTRKRTSSTRSSSSRSRPAQRPSRNGSTAAGGSRNGSTASRGSSTASKVKAPALAGGAALLGLAGGVALGATRRKSGAQVFGKSLAEAGRNVGQFGENLGQFAVQMERTREMIDNGTKRRSPIEVVLQALTQRR